ncbi:MAG: MotA/TolQ/ExbB proton channel family protein [Kiritimatiellia bacterium]
MLNKVMFGMLLAALLAVPGIMITSAQAQDAAAPAGDAVAVAPGMEVDAAAAASAAKPKSAFAQVLFGSGFFGFLLWMLLAACSIAGVALIVDSFVNIRAKKIAPEALAEEVKTAMGQGDVMKALKHCEDNPGPLAAILSAGFSNVEEGFEAIQDSVGVAADLESEKLLQRVAYLNLVGNLAPMLGLLGTVQGMIMAFATLATQSAGAAQQAALAMNISQALYTTAAGLLVAVPAVAFFYFFKNRATRIILSMEGMTMELIKALRNVEVVEE